MSKRFLIEIAGFELEAELYTESAPRSCEAFFNQLPLSDEIIHARWSGPLCLTRRVNLGNLSVENPTPLLNPGDIVYHPTHFDVGIAYGPTQFIEQVGPVYVTLLGRVVSDITPLIEVGKKLQQSGAIPVTFKVENIE